MPLFQGVFSHANDPIIIYYDKFQLNYYIKTACVHPEIPMAGSALGKR
jgi:hypothetical protein